MSKGYKTAGPRHAHIPYDPYYPEQGTNKRKPKEYMPVSTGNWIGTFILCLIPVLNYVMFFIWTFNKNVVPSKKNFGRALFIITTTLLVLAAIAFVVMVYVFNYDFGAYYTDILRRLTTTA